MLIEQELQEKEYFLPYHYLWNIGTYIGNQYFSGLNKLKKLIREHHCKNILDVGCGDGRFCFELRNENLKYTGVDISERAIKFAKIFSPSAKFYCRDIRKLNFSHKFDGIILMEVLEHIPINELTLFLKKLNELLQDKAYLFITVPSRIVPKEKKHFQHFSEETLEKTLNPFFQVNFISYHDKKSFILNLCYKLMFAFLAPSDYFSSLKKLRPITCYFYERFLATADKSNGKRLIAVCQKLNF